MKDKPEEKKKIGFWATIGLVILGLILWGVFSGNTKGEYKDCVDSCVLDSSSCISDFEFCVFNNYAYSQSRVGYVLSDDYKICEVDLDSCSDDLEFCIDDCGN